jgi:hypothetical protein
MSATSIHRHRTKQASEGVARIRMMMMMIMMINCFDDDDIYDCDDDIMNVGNVASV